MQAPRMAEKFRARDAALSQARQAIGRRGSPHYTAQWARNVMSGQVERAREFHRAGMAIMRWSADTPAPAADSENFRASAP